MSGWNGSGVFTFPYNFEQDAANGINIRADRMDSQFFIISTNGFANTLTRDGQGIATANLPMNSFKHTGAGDGANSGDYATYNQAAILALDNTFAGDNTFSGSNTFTASPQTIEATHATLLLVDDSAGLQVQNTAGRTAVILGTAKRWDVGLLSTDTALGNFGTLSLYANGNTGTPDFLINSSGNCVCNGTITGSNLSGTHSGSSSGTNTGDQTITLTGDVTGSGTGSFAATIANTSAKNAGTNALGARTVSTSGPSGTPADGDIWIQRVP